MVREKKSSPFLRQRHDIKAAPAPPKKIQTNSAKRDAVSPVTNKVTWPEIALISPGRIKARSRHALPRLKQGIVMISRPWMMKPLSFISKQGR